MTDKPQGEGWWLASDGKWYPPESRPAPPAPPPPVGSPEGGVSAQALKVTRRWLAPGLTGTLFGFLIGTSGLAVIAGLLYFGTYGVWIDWDQGGSSTINDLIDLWDTADVASGFFALAYLVTAVLMIVWFNQAYKAAQSRGGMDRKWSSGWAVGGWFIPVANFVIPKMVVNEIDRMSDEQLAEPIGTAWQQSRRSVISDWWWSLWVIGTISMWVAGAGADEFAGGWLAARGLAFLLLASSGVLSAIFVRSLGRRLQRPRQYPMQ